MAAGLSDGVDGFLARRFDMKSALGAYLDPIADKLLLMTSYLFLAIPSYPALVKVPVWLAVMVLSRDFLLMVVGLLLILTSGRKRFPPTWAGKVTTVTQIVNVLFVLCANIWEWPRAGPPDRLRRGRERHRLFRLRLRVPRRAQPDEPVAAHP